LKKTKWQKDIWTSFYNVNLEKIKIIENCYYEKKEGVVSSVKNFLGAGRHISVKNLDYLSQAFEEVKKEVSDIELDIGIYSPQDYEERLKSCYAVVSVSLSEISPNSIIEAIAYNKPFIITKYNGISERLNGAGIKIDPNNLNDIKKAIISLSQDRKYKMEVNKVKKINLVRSYENIAEEFINLFSKNV
jgi:glycosyltransferase involved in cell wall biosynthesis